MGGRLPHLWFLRSASCVHCVKSVASVTPVAFRTLRALRWMETRSVWPMLSFVTPSWWGQL